MKHKTSELTGALLDAAVQKAWGDPTEKDLWIFGLSHFRELRPSYSWSHAGPIIEIEKITVVHCPAGFTAGDEWEAYIGYVDPRRLDLDPADGEGPTPLIAAMRAYVASKLGNEVDL